MSNAFKKFYFLAFIICYVNAFSSCQSSQVNTKPENKDNQTSTSITSDKLKANNVLDALKKANLPIDRITVYTAETDLNKLLGRPNQYIEKISWIDKRIKENSTDNLVGGTIEVFDSVELVEKRRKYIEEIGKSAGIFTQYQYAHKNVLLRLDKELTPQQASEYEKVLKDL
jgi:hypothetical protein